MHHIIIIHTMITLKARGKHGNKTFCGAESDLKMLQHSVLQLRHVSPEIILCLAQKATCPVWTSDKPRRTTAGIRIVSPDQREDGDPEPAMRAACQARTGKTFRAVVGTDSWLVWQTARDTYFYLNVGKTFSELQAEDFNPHVVISQVRKRTPSADNKNCFVSCTLRWHLIIILVTSPL